MQTAIPLYTADGELCDWISHSRMARLQALNLIQVVRHKKGAISRCILHRREGDALPVPLIKYLGQRCHYREHLDSGHVVWALKQALQRSGEIRSAKVIF